MSKSISFLILSSFIYMYIVPSLNVFLSCINFLSSLTSFCFHINIANCYLANQSYGARFFNLSFSYLQYYYTTKNNICQQKI